MDAHSFVGKIGVVFQDGVLLVREVQTLAVVPQRVACNCADLMVVHACELAVLEQMVAE